MPPSFPASCLRHRIIFCVRALVLCAVSCLAGLPAARIFVSILRILVFIPGIPLSLLGLFVLIPRILISLLGFFVFVAGVISLIRAFQYVCAGISLQRLRHSCSQLRQGLPFLQHYFRHLRRQWRKSRQNDSPIRSSDIDRLVPFFRAFRTFSASRLSRICRRFLSRFRQHFGIQFFRLYGTNRCKCQRQRQ